jgi:hypothetical protein
MSRQLQQMADSKITRSCRKQYTKHHAISQPGTAAKANSKLKTHYRQWKTKQQLQQKSTVKQTVTTTNSRQ